MPNGGAQFTHSFTSLRTRSFQGFKPSFTSILCLNTLPQYSASILYLNILQSGCLLPDCKKMPQYSASILCLNTLPQYSTSIFCSQGDSSLTAKKRINTLPQYSDSILCLNTLHQYAASILCLNNLPQYFAVRVPIP